MPACLSTHRFSLWETIAMNSCLFYTADVITARLNNDEPAHVPEMIGISSALVSTSTLTCEKGGGNAKYMYREIRDDPFENV